MTREEFTEMAWRDFMLWAVSEPAVVKRFNAETGHQFTRAMSPLDAMIDEATGKAESDAKAFMIWATKELWGIDEAPTLVREEIRSLE